MSKFAKSPSNMFVPSYGSSLPNHNIFENRPSYNLYSNSNTSSSINNNVSHYSHYNVHSATSNSSNTSSSISHLSYISSAPSNPSYPDPSISSNNLSIDDEEAVNLIGTLLLDDSYDNINNESINTFSRSKDNRLDNIKPPLITFASSNDKIYQPKRTDYEYNNKRIDYEYNNNKRIDYEYNNNIHSRYLDNNNSSYLNDNFKRRSLNNNESQHGFNVSAPRIHTVTAPPISYRHNSFQHYSREFSRKPNSSWAPVRRGGLHKVNSDSHHVSNNNLRYIQNKTFISKPINNSKTFSKAPSQSTSSSFKEELPKSTENSSIQKMINKGGFDVLVNEDTANTSIPNTDITEEEAEEDENIEEEEEEELKNYTVKENEEKNRRSKNHRDLWMVNEYEEKLKIKEFWLCLSEEERHSLVRVEKNAIIAKLKEQQKHICSCSVCGRRRHVMEEELDTLYDTYYHEIRSQSGQTRDDPSKSLTVRGGVMSVADDLLRNEGKKFLEMMEKCAERRIRRNEEQAELEVSHVLDNTPPRSEVFDSSSTLSRNTNACLNSTTFGIIKPDSHDGVSSTDANLNEDDDPETEEYDEYSEEEELLTEDQRLEQGRRLFQMFAAKMFEQRVVHAFREKIALEKQRALIEEEEEEHAQQRRRKLKKKQKKQQKKTKKTTHK